MLFLNNLSAKRSAFGRLKLSLNTDLCFHNGEMTIEDKILVFQEFSREDRMCSSEMSCRLTLRTDFSNVFLCYFKHRPHGRNFSIFVQRYLNRWGLWQELNVRFYKWLSQHSLQVVWAIVLSKRNLYIKRHRNLNDLSYSIAKTRTFAVQ